MAATPRVVTDAHFTINTVDLSEHVKSCKVTANGETKDVTAMSATAWKAFAAGLKSATLDIEFVDDFSASKVDATLWAAFNTAVAFIYRTQSGAVGTTNPELTGSVLVDKYEIGAAVGDPAMKSLSLPITGALARATS